AAILSESLVARSTDEEVDDLEGPVRNRPPPPRARGWRERRAPEIERTLHEIRESRAADRRRIFRGELHCPVEQLLRGPEIVHPQVREPAVDQDRREMRTILRPGVFQRANQRRVGRRRGGESTLILQSVSLNQQRLGIARRRLR